MEKLKLYFYPGIFKFIPNLFIHLNPKAQMVSYGVAFILFLMPLVALMQNEEHDVVQPDHLNPYMFNLYL